MTDFDQREYVAVFDQFEVRTNKRGYDINHKFYITDLKTQVGPGDEYRLTLRHKNFATKVRKSIKSLKMHHLKAKCIKI